MLKGTHLPITIKEIQAGYLKSPYFKDIYLYLSQNKLPSSKNIIRKIEALSEKYYLTRLIIVQIEYRKGKGRISNTRDMC